MALPAILPELPFVNILMAIGATAESNAFKILEFLVISNGGLMAFSAICSSMLPFQRKLRSVVIESFCRLEFIESVTVGALI